MTHAGTRRYLAAWQEQWELGFDRDEKQASYEQKTLEILNGLTSVLSQRLAAFADPQGKDYKGGWFSNATDVARASRVNDLAESALTDFDRRREAVRGAAQLVDSARSGAQAAASETLQRGFELIAIIFLVPGLVAAVYGANVSLPGQNRWSGLVILLTAMLLSSVLTFAILHRRSRT